MTRLMVLTCLVVLVSAFSSASNNANGQVPEIANPNLPDIAMVTLDGFGNPVIVYNPILCQRAGPALCEFYRVHEYGHIALGHAFVQSWPWRREAEADCWAAQNAPPAAVEAAYQWFSAGGGATPQHGSGWQRAQRLAQCANF